MRSPIFLYFPLRNVKRAKKASLINEYLRLLETGRALEKQAKNGVNDTLRKKLLAHGEQTAELNKAINKLDPKIFREIEKLIGTQTSFDELL